jgi:hypothetical protein
MDTHALTTIDTDRIGRCSSGGIVIARRRPGARRDRRRAAPADLMPSWLIGFLFCTGLSLGSLSAADDAAHERRQLGLVTRRIFEAGTRLLPYCVLLFMPVAIFAPKLFLWAQGRRSSRPTRS